MEEDHPSNRLLRNPKDVRAGDAKKGTFQTVSFQDEVEDEVIVTSSSSATKANEETTSSSWSQRILGKPIMANILVTELCERYSYYALRAILVIFFSDEIGWSDDAAVSVVFFSTALTYFMPLLGGYVADAKIGKFKSILYFCVVYIAGSATLTIGASAKSAAIAILGLCFIAVGTGGIKPNVSAFGADQLADCDPAVKERFFRVFYFSINIGAVLSYIISPLLRQHAGYSVAFGVPTIFLCLATWTFWSARASYVKEPPSGSPIAVVYRTLRIAYRQRSTNLGMSSKCDADDDDDDDDEATSSGPAAPVHWIERARGVDGCGDRDVKETLAVWRVAKVLAILPIFWMLYDQQASAWTLQAERMDLHGLQPEQMGVVNPILVLLLIPIFDQFIYPRWEASTYLPPLTPLRKIGVGMLICAASFVLSAVVEGMIAEADEENSISVFLQLPQLLVISVSEILVSITGLEWSYANAPASMKSCVMALFLVTTAVGDLLGGGLYSGVGSQMSPAGLFMLCAVLMAVNTVFFAYVAKRFEPSDSTDRPTHSLTSSAAMRRPSYDSISGGGVELGSI
eukprot:g3022.t1